MTPKRKKSENKQFCLKISVTKTLRHFLNTNIGKN